ncbi:hypothetical protein [Actinoplanes sp. NPDC049316]|uniref:hypothetical protein n=1 Tax=Actinoplanes sp. NPDC049316 TaxID=3154727 RepID=UPI00343007F2
MSDATKRTTGRRSTAVLLGGLAAGAVLGAALGVAGDTAGDTSVKDQFRSAFTPGAVEAESLPMNRIVVTEP